MRKGSGRSTRHARGLGASTLSYERAVEIQNRLHEKLVLTPPTRPIRIVAGADVGFARDMTTAIAGMVLFSWPGLRVLDVSVALRPVDFPYVPGLLSFREIPVLLAAYRRLSGRPDVIFCDGQGIAHPRRFGLACHLGVVLDMPTVGCAKSVLVGEFREPGRRRGSKTRMRDAGECVGWALRTRENVKPMYVSPGHLMDLDAAGRLTLSAGRGYRVPEPTRAAHNLVARVKALARDG